MSKLPLPKMKLNILFLGSQMEVAGAQKLLLEQAGWFQNRGHKVTVVFLYDKANLFSSWVENYPFPIINLKAKRPGSASLLNLVLYVKAAIKFFVFLVANQFDVIETFTIHSNIFGIPIAFLAGIPSRIPTHHGTVGGTKWGLKKIHGFIVNSKMTSGLIAVSEKAGSVAIVDEGIREDKINIILNGIKIPEIGRNQNLRLARRELGISDDEILIISVGRLVEQKGFAYFIQAAKKIIDTRNNARFVIVGDGELRATLEEQAKYLNVSDSVEFVGVRDDVLDLLMAADIYLTTSLWEGLSLALLEAMAAGLPVVTTAVEGVSNVIENDKNGIVVPIRDIDAIESAVSRLIVNLELRRSLGEKAIKTIIKNHSNIKMCLEYENLFLSFFP